MGNWEIIVSEAETNLITNPSIEVATTGYAAIGSSTLSRSFSDARRGLYSLTITPSAGVNDGASYTVAFTAGSTYTFSVDVKGVDGIPYKIYFATTGGTLKGTATQFTGTGDWQRVYVTWTCDFAFSGDGLVCITKNNSANTDIFYADGFQVSNVAYNTTYIDGDRKGLYKWNGTINASTSTRDAQERSGGRIYDLEDLNITVLEEAGIGMPPVSHFVQNKALFPGATYLGQKIKERVIDLIFYAKGTSYNELHSIRNTIINYIKNDRVRDNQPFILRYTGANSTKPVEISCVYDSGMEWKDISGIGEKIALRVIAYDPFFYEDGTDAVNLTTSQSITNANYAVKKINGTWARVSAAFNGSVYAFTIGLDGSVYIAGNFTNVGDANGDYIVKYDPTTGNLSSLGTGLDDYANTLVTASNGDIYVGGAFNSAGGVANTESIARWDGSAWNSVGGGISGTSVETLVFGQDGVLYIGGDFVNHGDSNGDYITKWNGTAYSSLGTGMDGAVYSLAIAPNGNLIATGEFTTAGGTTVNGIAKWNGSSWSALGSGLSGGASRGNSVTVDKAGNIYLGGSFTSVDGVSANYIAKYNGISWEALGTGTSSQVAYITIDEDGILYAGGAFTSAGGITLANGIAIWNGSTWSHLDIDFPGFTGATAILVIGDDLYLGYSTSGTATSSYLTTVTNLGSVTAYPEFYFKPTISGVLEWIKNETTDKTLYCNYTILPGEILVIDLDPNERKVESSFFGNVIGRAILRNSDFADFNLLPGTNDISVFITTSGSVTSYITYPITHWSADGVA